MRTKQASLAEWSTARFDPMESDVVMAGLVPAIHALVAARKTWMRGISPRMTGIQTSETSSTTIFTVQRIFSGC